MSEGSLYGQGIVGQRFAHGGLADLHVVGNTAEGQKRHRNAAAESPHIGGSGKQLIQFAALGAELPGQGDGREPGGLGYAYFVVGGP